MHASIPKDTERNLKPLSLSIYIYIYIPWRRAWQPTPVFLPGESHGPKSLVGYSPWGRTESDPTEVTIYMCVCVYIYIYMNIQWIKKSRIMWYNIGLVVKQSACNTGDLGLIPGLRRSPGEGNGYPLQYSCLENPMDIEAWWASPWGHRGGQDRATHSFFFLIWASLAV